jgi:predicted nucleic acid-binding Zn ribbon protein
MKQNTKNSCSESCGIMEVNEAKYKNSCSESCGIMEANEAKYKKLLFGILRANSLISIP